MKLSDKIWFTRKARIATSERLGWCDFFSKIIITLYSVFVVALSIYELVFKTDRLSIATVIASVMILSASIFISTMNFMVRSFELKNCYIRLEKLRRHARLAEEENDNERLEKINDDYDTILLMSENHSAFDYLLARKNATIDDENPELTRYENAKLIIYRLVPWVVFGLFMLLPTVGFYYYI